MLGSYDFCGHYEWTFAWLEREGGGALLREFWAEAIGRDSQRHLAELIAREGLDGMQRYWSQTLADESPTREFTLSAAPGVFRIDMHDCPSKGFLLRNGLAQHADYCDHCIGWIGPLLRDAGFVIDHEHNHCGQCWWEMRKKDSAAPGPEPAKDVRAAANWNPHGARLDRFQRATGDSSGGDGRSKTTPRAQAP